MNQPPRPGDQPGGGFFVLLGVKIALDKRGVLGYTEHIKGTAAFCRAAQFVKTKKNALASKASRNYFLLRNKTAQSEITDTISITKAKSPSYVIMSTPLCGVTKPPSGSSSFKYSIIERICQRGKPPARATNRAGGFLSFPVDITLDKPAYIGYTSNIRHRIMYFVSTPPGSSEPPSSDA